MKTEDIWNLITSQPKWYAGIKNKNGKFHNAQSANRMKNRFKQGRLSESVIESVFNYYGYVKNETTWVIEK